MGIVKFSVASAGVPVGNVSISVLDSNGDVDSISSTDDAGICIFDLAAGSDYFIVASHPDHVIQTYKIPALELGTYDIVAIQKTLKISANPIFCLIQGVFTDLQNIQLPSWTFNVEAAEGFTGTDESIFYGDTAITAENGVVEFSLVGGVSYIFKNLPFCKSKAVYVPSTRSASLTDLVSPIVTTLGGLPADFDLNLNSSTSFSIIPTLSNTLTGADVSSGWVAIELTVEGIIEASISDTYEVTITSKDKVGQVTVSFVATLDPENGVYTRIPKRTYGSFVITIG